MRIGRSLRVHPPTVLLAALLLFATLGLAFAFTRWTSTSGWAFPHFLLAVLLLVYLPGRALLGWLGITASWLEEAMLSVAFGIPASSAVYWLAARLGVRWLIWVFVAGVAVALLRSGRLRPGWRLASVRYGHALLLLAIACGIAPLAVSGMHFRNLARTADGGMTFYPLADPVLRVALANELSHAVPPQVPFVPGRPLSYHHGMDFLAALIASAGVDTMDLSVRFVPLLLMIFAGLSCFCLARSWLGSEAAGALAVVLILLGEDFSFVPGLLTGTREIWAVFFFGIPGTVSLYTLNPMLPGLGFLMAILFCLGKFFGGGQQGWLLGAALLAPTLVEYKVFGALLVICGLGVTSLVRGLRYRDWSPLRALLAVALPAFPFVLSASAANTGRIQILLSHWPYVPAAIVRMGLGETSFMRIVDDFYRGRGGLGSALVYCGIALPLYLLLTLGARTTGVACWARSLRGRDSLRLLVASIVLIGIAAALLLAMVPSGYPPLSTYNESATFLVHGKFLLWLFAVGSVWSWAAGRRARQLAGAVALLALSLPSGLQFIALRAAEPLPVVGPGTRAMLEFVRTETPAGAVCLAREPIALLILGTTSCHAPLFEFFPHLFPSPQERFALRDARDQFWLEWRSRRRDDILSGLSVDYVIVDLLLDGPAPAPPAGGPGLALEERFRNDVYLVYGVRRPPR